MSVIDEYLQSIVPDKREALERIRQLAKQIVPDAKEIISYKMPTLTYLGKPFLGFDIRKNHIGIYPYSGWVISQLSEVLQRFKTSSGAIQVPFDAPITKEELTAIISKRIEQIHHQLSS